MKTLNAAPKSERTSKRILTQSLEKFENVHPPPLPTSHKVEIITTSVLENNFEAQFRISSP